jgi:hypothetical protein
MAVGMAIDSASSGFKGQVEAVLGKTYSVRHSDGAASYGLQGRQRHSGAPRSSPCRCHAMVWRVGLADAMRLLCVCMKALVHCNVLKVNA